MKPSFPVLLIIPALFIASGTLAIAIDLTANSPTVIGGKAIRVADNAATNSTSPQTLTPDFALKLAKQAGMKLPSPPRMWRDSQANVELWSSIPDTLTQEQYFNCGIVPVGANTDYCMATVTFVPHVRPNPNGGYTVMLQVGFGDPQSPSIHAWEFWVKDTKTVEFIQETGVGLIVPVQ
jgi:hypothetical protein